LKAVLLLRFCGLSEPGDRTRRGLDPEHVYEQVIAESGRYHGVLDLLAMTRTNRLAIIELKATENPELPLQAADYWERMRRHQVLGDIERYGYFPRMQLQSASPLVYLVAPAWRFHPTTDVILRYFSPDRNYSCGAAGKLAPRTARCDAPVERQKSGWESACLTWNSR